MEETTSSSPQKTKKRQIRSFQIKKEVQEYLEKNVMTGQYLIDNAPEWRETIIEQGKQLTQQNKTIIELETTNNRLLRENLDLLRFKSKILEEKYGLGVKK